MRTGTTRSGTSETARGTKDLNFTKTDLCQKQQHHMYLKTSSSFFILGQHIHSTVIYEDSFKKKFANC